MDASNNQSWILPKLAGFLRTYWPEGDRGVSSYKAASELYAAYAVHLAEQRAQAQSPVADDGALIGQETKRKHVVNLGRQITRLLERAELARAGKPFSSFKRPSMVRFLQAARIVVRTGIADLMALMDEVSEADAGSEEVTIEGAPAFIRVRRGCELTASQIEAQLGARGEERDWIHKALATFDPSIGRPETIETLSPLELEIMLAKEAPPRVPWARLTIGRTPTLRDSPTILTRVRNRRAGWVKTHPEPSVIGALCWALAPLRRTWHVMNEKERLDFVIRQLKAIDDILAAEVKAYDQPELAPYHPPASIQLPPEEEVNRLLLEEEEAIEEPQAVQVSTPHGPVTASGSSVVTLTAEWGKMEISRERVESHPDGIEGVARDWAEKTFSASRT